MIKKILGVESSIKKYELPPNRTRRQYRQFGLCEMADGLVAVITGGRYSSRFGLDYAIKMVKEDLDKA